MPSPLGDGGPFRQRRELWGSEQVRLKAQFDVLRGGPDLDTDPSRFHAPGVGFHVPEGQVAASHLDLSVGAFLRPQFQMPETS